MRTQSNILLKTKKKNYDINYDCFPYMQIYYFYSFINYSVSLKAFLNLLPYEIVQDQDNPLLIVILDKIQPVQINIK